MVFAPSSLRRLSSMWMSQFPFESIKGQVYIALCQHKVEHLFQLNSGSATSRLELAYSGFANAISWENARLEDSGKQLQRQQQTGLLIQINLSRRRQAKDESKKGVWQCLKFAHSLRKNVAFVVVEAHSFRASAFLIKTKEIDAKAEWEWVRIKLSIRRQSIASQVYESI